MGQISMIFPSLPTGFLNKKLRKNVRNKYNKLNIYRTTKKEGV